MAKASVKNDQPTALDVYIAGGMNFASLVEALLSLTKSSAGQAETDKLLTELLKKLCLSAQGSRYAITLTKAEAPNFLQFLVIACEDTRDAGALLSALEARPASFREKYQDVIKAFLAKAAKVVPKLVTHLQKTRNPDSQVDAFVPSDLRQTDWVVGSELQARRISVTNAELVGQRWFWEATVSVESVHLQVSDLVAVNPDVDWFWKLSSSPSLPLPSRRFPAYVGSLSHQLLFECAENQYLSLTPLTSVGGLSQLAASASAELNWRRKTAKYGGDKPQNIAALLSGRAGFILHPINAPRIAPSQSPESLLKYVKTPRQLITRLKLSEHQVDRLFEPHAAAANNASRQTHVLQVLEPLLERACIRLLSFRDLFLLDQASTTLLNDDHVVTDWIKSPASFSDSRYSELADFTLTAALGPISQHEFLRWSELKVACASWLKAS